LGMLGVGLGVTFEQRRARNVDLPAYAALCIVFAFALHGFCVGAARLRLGSFVRARLALAQFVVMINNPRALCRTWPTPGPASAWRPH